jgi:hypothetical protein
MRLPRREEAVNEGVALSRKKPDVVEKTKPSRLSRKKPDVVEKTKPSRLSRKKPDPRNGR